MSSFNNINTGLASKVDSFRWSGSMDNKTHVLGVKTSAPDYSIPPTPASSYQNIHIALDQIHPSSITTRTETLGEQTQVRSVATSSRGTEFFSSLPKFSDNRLDDVPRSSSRLVLDAVDPEQPMARSEVALTSLKSEIAPLVPLDELAERTDRELPPSVDLTLFDETEAELASQSLSKSWVLKEEDERSWRMSRDVDSTWKSNWSAVSKQLNGEGSFNLSSLEDSERQWRMNRPVDSQWSSNWKNVGRELQSSDSELNLALADLSQWSAQLTADLEKESRKVASNVAKIGPALEELNRSIDRAAWKKLTDLEEEERSWRSSRKIDPVLQGLWYRIGQDLMSKYALRNSLSGLGESIAEKASSLADKAVESLESLLDRTQEAIISAEESLLPTPPTEFAEHKHLNMFAFTAENVDFTFKSRRTPSYIIELEEAERADRISKYKSNRDAYRRWNKFLIDSLPQSNVQKAEGVLLSAVHMAENGISGFLGSLAHSVASTLHMTNETAASSKDIKVDPMSAARKGRVNDEILNLTVKSV